MKYVRTLATVVVVAALYMLTAHLFAGVGGLSMAVASTAISDMDEIQKIIYSGTVVDQVVTDSELMDQFLENTAVETDETTGGYYIKRAHIIGLPGGSGARAEGDYIPEADAAKFINSIIYLRKYHATVGPVTGDVMRRIKNDLGAFEDYMAKAMPWAVERLTNTLDIDYLGYGASIRSRAVGTPSLVSTSLYDLEIDSAMGIAGMEDAWIQHLVNERLVFSSTAAGTAMRAGAALGRSALVVAIIQPTDAAPGGKLRLTMDSTLAAAITDNDYIFPGDTAGASSQNSGVDRALQGLMAAVDDGNVLSTYLGVDRSDAANASFRGLVVDGAASPFDGTLTEDLLSYTDAQARRINAAKVDLIVSSIDGVRAYRKSLRSDRMFIDPQRYKGGDIPAEILLGDRTVPLKEARKLPPQLTFGLSRAAFTRHHLGQFVWDDITGSIWNRVVDATGRKDEFFGTGVMYEQLSCKNPMKNWRIKGLVRA